MFTQRWTQKPPQGVRINPAHPSSRGLVGCWMFNEGSGDRVYDLSGYGNHGTLKSFSFPPTPSSGWNPSKHGPGLAFGGTGSDDHIEIPRSDSITVGTGNYTIAAWIYPRSLSGWIGVVTKVKDSVDKEYSFTISDGKLRLDVEKDGNDGIGQTDAVVLTINTWYHAVVTMTWETTTPAFYVNGVFKPQTDNITVKPDWLTNYLHIGWVGGFYDGYEFEGIIEEVRIYNRALTAQEVLELYTNLYGMFEWPMPISPEAPPPPTRTPRSPAVSGVPSAHF